MQYFSLLHCQADHSNQQVSIIHSTRVCTLCRYISCLEGNHVALFFWQCMLSIHIQLPCLQNNMQLAHFLAGLECQHRWPSNQPEFESLNVSQVPHSCDHSKVANIISNE